MVSRKFFAKGYKFVQIAFGGKNLFYTNVLLSMSISALGDLLEQSYQIYGENVLNYDFHRTSQMAFSGSTAGVICHHWYIFLDKVIIGKSLKMVIKKLLLDQFICSPIIILSFFATVAILEENPLENFTHEVESKFWTLYKAEWFVWPPAQIINFYFLPTRLHNMQAFGITWRKVASNLCRSRPVSCLRRTVKVAFSDKYLLYTNVTISVSLSSVGDLLQQTYEIYTEEQNNYDLKRTMHMAFSGAAVGVLCHHWYKILDKIIIGKTTDMVIKKLLLDQLLFSPIIITTFFGSLAIFEDNPLENFKEEVRDKFITLYRAEWMVWPPAQVINFYFLPTRFRVLYDNTISLGYDVYTSQVKHSKQLKSVQIDLKSKEA